jgi:hypothetical protein
MHIENGHFYAYLHEQAKKTPIYIAYTHIEYNTFAVEGKKLSQPS